RRGREARARRARSSPAVAEAEHTDERERLGRPRAKHDRHLRADPVPCVVHGVLVEHDLVRRFGAMATDDVVRLAERPRQPRETEAATVAALDRVAVLPDDGGRSLHVAVCDADPRRALDDRDESARYGVAVAEAAVLVLELALGTHDGVDTLRRFREE